MAKKENVTPLGLAIDIALYFLAGLTVIQIALGVGQYFMGNVTPEDFLNSLRVLKGERTYSVRVDEMQDYKRLLAKEKADLAEAEKTEGGLVTRTKSADALEALIQKQKEQAEMLARQLQKEQEKLQALRKDIEARKAEKAQIETRITELKEERLTVQQSARLAHMKKVLDNMDEGDIARYLEGIAEKRGGAYEAARYLSRYFLKPDKASGVLTEMNADVRQKILPLLENQYADLRPGQVVQQFKDEKLEPEEIAQMMKQMNAVQAFGVYFQLEPALGPDKKDKVAQLLQQPVRQP